ncbi:MAG: bifunctional DNA-formamidopyrimidine glycosylase/DNA-(apurinic or apyrimidinic site) lyase [Candidatus Moraniibacteriota bacterium]|nr:MAG: bifunctional DNA-formamidopyrimidine glycosylase/DNA-(apurinic or apyrimidinic site) lyase [Candidatus Moranbacteria bacterium]
MPELPEVETIRRQLVANVSGAVVTGLEVRRVSCYFGGDLKEPEVINEVSRVGKYLYIHFNSGRGFAIHLKMTGRLVINVDTYNGLAHTRVVIDLSDGRKLYYWDARTFGYVKYVDDIKSEQDQQKARLGPDPWEISDEKFFALLKKYKRPIKNLILDQALISGVGNIYANDGLWEAGIDPRRAASSMSKAESKKLLHALRMIMERGLTTGGASDNSYVNALGQKGSYQDEFRVYKRTGKPCLQCGRILERIVVGGRGTWVCANCQK